MLSGLSEHGIVVLVLPGHHRVLRVVRLGGRQQRLDTEQDSPQGHGSGPLVLQNIQADGARDGGDVRVPDLGQEPHLGRVERVRVGDLKERALKLKLQFAELCDFEVNGKVDFTRSLGKWELSSCRM